MFNKQRQSGQLLIESLVAITIIVVAIVGIFSLLSRSLSLNRVISDQYTGTYLAAEGIEVVKNIVDSNVIYHCLPWNSGLSSGTYSLNYDSTALAAALTTPLNFDPVTGLYSHKSGGSPSKFYRNVTITMSASGDSMHVLSRVKWKTRGAAEFESRLEDTFYNWRPPSANCTAGSI